MSVSNGLTSSTSSIEISDKVPGTGYNNTNIKLGLLGNGVNDIETVTITSSRAVITNVGYVVNTDFNRTTVGFNITVPATAVQLQLSSTSINDTATGSGANVVRVIGLNSDWMPLQEDIVLNGQTGVLSTNTNWLRINSMLVIQSNNGANGIASNAGNIYVTDSADTLTAGEPDTRLYCSIAIGKNQSTHGIYSVRSGYSFVSTHFKSSSDATESKPLLVRNFIKFLNIPRFTLVDLTYGGNVSFILDGIPNIPEKSDIYITSQSGPTSLDRATLWWSGILKKNSKFTKAIKFNNENLLS